jgi:hypothetical protein
MLQPTPTIGPLNANSRFFTAPDGRSVFLRGVNLSSSVKQPLVLLRNTGNTLTRAQKLL